MNQRELEWKAEWMHNMWMVTKAEQGFHFPDTHLEDLTQVPPHIRDDGRTRCDKCHLAMVPYKDLPDKDKDLDRQIILNSSRCQKAWLASNGGKIKRFLLQKVA